MSKIRSDLVLSESAFHAVIDAPIERINIAKWLFSLPEAEYQRCAPPDHIAAGYTTTDDGQPMSINVEMIGTGLMIQHYVAEIAEKDHCHMVSTSDVFTPNGPSKVQVIWDLSAKRTDDSRCEYTNSVIAHPTEEFLVFIKEHGISFEQAAKDRQAAGSDHNRRETPLYAASIGRAALATE
ncbi:hypothetical protein [Streptomyces sp. NPDC056244]|uniref:hypothetical protein n=1 Tax=unclassified Streptomyces TaxID=2593676 RepID=UPI0035E27B7F